MALYSSGIYVGAGIGIFIGGLIVDNWDQAFPNPDLAPLGLKGWQVAFMSVGLPGVLMAFIVYLLKEPIRGASDGLPEPKLHPHPFKMFLDELARIIPGLSLVMLHGIGGVPMVIANLIGMGIIGGTAIVLTLLTGDASQWILLGVGVYAVFCWIQATRHTDPVAFNLLFKTKTVLYGLPGFGLLAFVGYGTGFWSPPMFIRYHQMDAGEAGLYLGLTSAIAGLIGVTLGGVGADLWRSRTPAGRFYWALTVAAVVSLPATLLLFLIPSSSTGLALVVYAIATVGAPTWIGAATSSMSDLVLPRMRALAISIYILSVTFIGLALGPYGIGKVSVLLSDGTLASLEPGNALRYANVIGTLMLIPAVILLWMASRHLPRDEATIIERARELGEPIDDKA